MEHLKNFGYLFYIANPYETSFEKLSDIPKPDYVGRAFPYFFGLIFMEQIILKLKGIWTKWNLILFLQDKKDKNIHELNIFPLQGKEGIRLNGVKETRLTVDRNLFHSEKEIRLTV